MDYRGKGFKIAETMGLEEFQEIMACSFDGILVADGQANVLYANKAYERNTGIKLDDIVSHNIKEFINPEWMPESVVLLAIERRDIVSINQFTKHKRHIVVTGTPIFDKDNKIKLVVVNTRDISKIYRMQEELRNLEKTNQIYEQQIKLGSGNENDNAIVLNAKMREIYDIAKRICNFDTTVLIAGDSGTGKEMVARYLHEQSEVRKKCPFVAVNCGAIPENLLESELFGYEEGAFTGAVKGGRRGLFETANGGTLFLDEVGEIGKDLQVKLLRILETKAVTRVGGSNEKRLDIRVIAATNRNLEKEVEKGNFREDLFYRLNVINFKLPSLRERKDEIGPLALLFLKQFNEQYNLNKKLSYEVFQEMQRYHWPGNIRQLKNVIEHMVVVSNDEYLHLNDVPWKKIGEEKELKNGDSRSLKEMMDDYEKAILMRAKNQHISTRKIAKALQVDQSTIVRKLNKYKIE